MPAFSFYRFIHNSTAKYVNLYTSLVIATLSFPVIARLSQRAEAILEVKRSATPFFEYSVSLPRFYPNYIPALNEYNII